MSILFELIAISLYIAITPTAVYYAVSLANINLGPKILLGLIVAILGIPVAISLGSFVFGGYIIVNTIF